MKLNFIFYDSSSEKKSSRKILLAVELTFLFLLGICLQISAQVGRRNITYSKNHTPNKKIFNVIKKKASYNFLYSMTMPDKATAHNIKLQNTRLRETVEEYFFDKRHIYTVTEGTAKVGQQGKDAEQNLQEILLQKIQGTVVDSATGQPLVGATIKVKGETIGTVTDANGDFILNVPDNAVLEVSSVGYVTKEISVNGKLTVNISLAAATTGLNQLVVVGYGTEKKKNITGSVDVVDVDALKSIPTASAEEALQGNAAGVNIYTSGSPGENGNVFIRGISSFGDSRPLVLIDGVEGDLSDVLPSNIKSLQVLKDAGAAAIYGVRGSNGVILITTKKGRRNKPLTVTYDAYVGVQVPFSGNPYNLMNPQDRMEVALKANPNDPLYQNGLPDYFYTGPNGSGNAKEGDPAVDPSLYNLNIKDPANTYLIAKTNKEGTNWYQVVNDPALMMNHNLSMSGGSEDATYMLSFGYLNEHGTLLNTYNKKYTIRVNTEFYITNNIRVGENMRAFYKDNPVINSNTGGPFRAFTGVYQMLRLFPPLDIRGNYAGTRLGVGTGSRGNPYAARDRAGKGLSSKSWNALGDIFAEADFLSDFTVRTQLGVRYISGYSSAFGFVRYEASEGYNNNNSYSESSSYSSDLEWTNTLVYENQFSKNHNLRILIGSEAIINKSRGISGSRENYFSNNPDYTVLSTGTENILNSSYKGKNTLFSLFTKLNYSYREKYLLEFTARRDGSSRFGKENRYGIFPSFSLGWRISNERFMGSLGWLDNLLIRGSYGILGSQNNVSPTNQYSTYGGSFATSYYPISGGEPEAGFIKTRIGNPFTKWERDKVTNMGIDFTIFKNFNVTAEYFKKEVEGLLFTKDLPGVVGGAVYPTVNIGNLSNSGFDFILSYDGQFSRDWSYSVGGNISFYKNEIVKVPDPGYFTTGSTQMLSGIIRNQEGHPISSFFGYDVIGLFQSEDDVKSSPSQTDAAPGLFKYKDVNEDGEITPDDRTFIGDPNPDFTYGLNLRLSYRDFFLSTNIYGFEGAELVNGVKAFTDFFGTYPASAKSNRLKNAWSENNTNTNVPKVISGGSFSTVGAMNSYFVENGSYLKMRSLILGYSISSNTLKNLGISKVRIYIQAKDLFTITSYSGLDPEIGGSSASYGIDKGTYPGNTPAYLLGINIEF